MHKLRMAMFVSLDGVIEEPQWTAPFWNDELARLQKDWLFASDALVLGRVTYQGFAAAWPTMTDKDGFAERMNALPKFVASRTLKAATWNATILSDEVVRAVARLKTASGGDLLIGGSGTLVSALTRHGLIDEYRLMVHPVVVGNGKRLFDGLPLTKLRHTGSVTTATGVVVLDYVPQAG